MRVRMRLTAIGVISVLALTLSAATSASAASVRLEVTPNQWQGWAVYGIQYFKVKCIWDDGRPDRKCSRAGTPHWSADYGWFERLRHGFAKTRMQVSPPSRRPQTKRGRTVLWSSDFNTDSDAGGHVTVRYAGASATVPVTAWQATNSGAHPLPKGYLQDQPSNPAVNNLADVGPVTAWGAQNDLDDPNYQAEKRQQATDISNRLQSYIRRWYRGKAPAVIPDSLFPDCCVAGNTLHWKLVRPKDFDPYSFWGSRVQQPDFNAKRDGITTLFPDINTTYVRAD